MYYKRKKIDVSTTQRNQDKSSRYDYNATSIDGAAGIRGGNEDIMDCR